MGIIGLSVRDRRCPSSGASAMAKRKAAKRTAKKSISGKGSKKQNSSFDRITFHFSGRVAGPAYSVIDLPVMAQELGGGVAGKLTDQVDYLVVDQVKQTSGIEKQAAKLNDAGASIKTIAAEAFLELYLPSTDEVLTLLKAGDEGITTLRKRYENVLRVTAKAGERVEWPQHDCSGINLRGIDLSNLKWATQYLRLDDADLRDAVLVRVPAIKSANLKGAKLGGSLEGLEGCNCVGADLSFATYHGEELRDCDFSEADLSHFALEEYRSGVKNMKLVDCCFRKSNWNDARADGIVAETLDFRETRFKKAELADASLQGSDFSGADFSNADLRRVDFSNANLSKAKFDGAELMQANLTNATVDGADFSKAEIAEVYWTGIDKSNAKGIPTDPTRKVEAGPKVEELSAMALKAKRVDISILVEMRSQVWKLKFSHEAGWARAHWYKDEYAGFTSVGSTFADFTTLQEAIVHAATMLVHGTLQPDTLEIQISNGRLREKFYQRTLEALSEAFGVPAATPEEVGQAKDDKQSQEEEQAAVVIAELKGGVDGLKKWAKRASKEWNDLPKCHSADLSGAVLDGVYFPPISDFQGSNFDQTSMVKTKLNGDFSKSTFRSAVMTECDLNHISLEEADLSSADFRQAKLRIVNLNGANLSNTDLRRADLSLARLQGATLDGTDLRGANLSHFEIQGVDLSRTIFDERAYRQAASWRESDPDAVTTFQCAEFDEHTRFPDPTRYPISMWWRGKGVDPLNRSAQDVASRSDFCSPEELLALLKGFWWGEEINRLGKVLPMLRSGQNEIAVGSSGKEVAGVVKSLKKPDAVYACRLTHEGAFSCCSKNLRPCGGLRGDICKHIMLLLFAMAVAGKLRPDELAKWITASQSQKPELDKSLMEDVFAQKKKLGATKMTWKSVATQPADFKTFWA